MDIEHLSKSQIILLGLLVSFVTSIATGIVTVSLMEQAPPSIAQSVNRIVERTVERVVPAPASQTAATVVTREKTVVIKEAELIPQAVDRASPSAVRIYLGEGESSFFLGLGAVLSPDGLIATDNEAVLGIVDATIVLPDGSRVISDVAGRDKDTGVAFLQAATSTADGKKIAWKPGVISIGSPRLGQTVIAIAGKSSNRIADGIITALGPELAGSSVIETNIPGESVLPGGLLINTDGEIIGIHTSASRAHSQSGFMSSSALIKKPAAVEKPAP